jgi:hypothetical protein
MDNKKHIPSYLIGLLIVVAIQISGFALLWKKIVAGPEYIYLSAASNTAGYPTETNVGMTPSVGIDKTAVENILRETVQSVLKQELREYLSQAVSRTETTSKQTSADPTGVKENSPANAQASAWASNIVSAAIARGVWTREDNVTLIPHVSQLTQSQRYQIMDEIGQAINRQELKIEDAPPSL